MAWRDPRSGAPSRRFPESMRPDGRRPFPRATRPSRRFLVPMRAHGCRRLAKGWFLVPAWRCPPGRMATASGPMGRSSCRLARSHEARWVSAIAGRVHPSCHLAASFSPMDVRLARRDVSFWGSRTPIMPVGYTHHPIRVFPSAGGGDRSTMKDDPVRGSRASLRRRRTPIKGKAVPLRVRGSPVRGTGPSFTRHGYAQPDDGRAHTG